MFDFVYLDDVGDVICEFLFCFDELVDVEGVEDEDKFICWC